MSSQSQKTRFEEFYKEHHPAILREAFRLTGKEADSWDLAQETFTRAYKTFGTFKPKTNGRAWLRTILTRLFIDHWRRQYLRKVVRVEDMDLPAPTPEEPPFWMNFGKDELEQAMTSLSREQRELIEQHVFLRQSYATLAERLQLAVPTVGSRLFRIRGALRTTLLDHQERAQRRPATARPVSQAA